MRARRRIWMVHILAGGLVGLVTLSFLGAVINGWSAGAPPLLNSTPPRLVSLALSEWTGSAPLALVIQSILYFSLGGTVGVATMPFAESGAALVCRSLAHFAVMALLVTLTAWTLGWIWSWEILLFYLALLTAVYLLIWLGRWVGWYAEVAAIREKLGLAPGPSLLKWKESLPYLGFAVILCLVLPFLLRLLDGPPKPLLSVLYGFVLLPVGGLFSGFSLGRREGFCPLYPLACAGAVLLFIPLARLISNMADGIMVPIAFCFALLGNLLGSAWRRFRRQGQSA